jgi:hypothetical protein
MKPETQKPRNTSVIVSVNGMPFEIDFKQNNLGPFYAQDITDTHYIYFQKRFLERMKTELGYNFPKLFKNKSYFMDMYKYYHNISKGTHVMGLLK